MEKFVDATGLSSESEKIWTISKTETSLSITCNGDLVVELEYATVGDECTTALSTDVAFIWFDPELDNASYLYRPQPYGKLALYNHDNDIPLLIDIVAMCEDKEILSA